MLTEKNIQPTGRLVLSRALYQEKSSGGILVPPESQERYPMVGEVISIGPRVTEDISSGDLVVFEAEMFDAPNTYLDCFEVILRDGDEDVRVLSDNDVEPIFKQYMDAYEANPSTEDRWIILRDLDSDLGFKFLASDVMSWGPAQIQSSSVQKLRYVETRMMELLDSKEEILRTFYLTDERWIQLVVRG